MAAIALRDEERIGLGVAIAAHALLVALIVLRPPTSPMLAPPERIAVTLSDDVGLTSTSPNPAEAAAPDASPEMGEPAPPEQVEEAPPEPRPEPRVEPRPQPRTQAATRTPPKPKPEPRAAPSPKPKPKPETRKPPEKASTRTPTKAPPRQTGSSRIDDDFLKGESDASGTSRNPAAANVSPQVRASFAQSVLRQVKPNWQGRVPQGLNTEKIVTILAVELNRDGTLDGRPQLIRQTGVDDTNRAQAPRHLEEAIKAVQLSAPFDLPPDMYEAWRKLPPLAFKK